MKKPNAKNKNGGQAPKFCLPNQDNNKRCLKDMLSEMPDGKYLLLYFYPRDNTPGCTVESIAFTNNKRKLKNAGVYHIVGISKLNSKSKQKFIEKHNLKIELLADEDCEVAKKYGVYKQKNMYGKKVWGISRETFLINKRGEIFMHFTKVKPETHTEEVLDYIKNFQANINIGK